jgi:uncharacterized protein YutE (UPF0331/DUF86 family)
MYLDKLKPIAEHTLKEYLADFYLKASAERLIQLIVDCASDINNHVVVEMEQRPPEDYASSFIRGSGGMRNILVHEYMDIDDEKVYKALPIALSDFKEYIRQVDHYLEKHKL